MLVEQKDKTGNDVVTAFLSTIGGRRRHSQLVSLGLRTYHEAQSDEVWLELTNNYPSATEQEEETSSLLLLPREPKEAGWSPRSVSSFCTAASGEDGLLVLH